MVENEKKHMIDYFLQSGFSLSEQQYSQFWKLYQLFIKYNDEYDLSRLKTFDDIMIKHFIDSIYITKFRQLPSPIIDIGTGPGFPGIPLKIVSPETYMILAEPRFRRVEFMQMVIKELGLTDIEIYPHTVAKHSFFNINGVVTRALESADDTLSRVHHFLPNGGTVLFMKGPDADEDTQGLSTENSARYVTDYDQEYTLPSTHYRRRLLVYTKIGGNALRTYSITKDKRDTYGTVITSADNKMFKEFKQYTSSQGIKKFCRTVVSGKKNISEIALRFPERAVALLIFEDYAEDDETINRMITDFGNMNKLYMLKKSLFNEIDILKTESPLLVCTTPEIPQWDGKSFSGLTLCIPFQDPANVGSAIRSAQAFSVSQILLLKESAHPFHPKCIRASGGTVFSAPLLHGPSIREIAAECESINMPLVTLDAAGTPIHTFNFNKNFFLMAGLEGPGLPAELKKDAIAIPINSNVESLNAAASLAIVLYEWNKQI